MLSKSLTLACFSSVRSQFPLPFFSSHFFFTACGYNACPCCQYDEVSRDLPNEDVEAAWAYVREVSDCIRPDYEDDFIGPRPDSSKVDLVNLTIEERTRVLMIPEGELYAVLKDLSVRDPPGWNDGSDFV